MFTTLVHISRVAAFQRQHCTKSNLLSLLVLTIIGGIICHTIQRRQADSTCHDTVTSVCRVLWYMNDTIKHCPNGSACNSTAMENILSTIGNDFSAWVSVQ